MKVRLWGTRGSLPTPGRDTVRYGGDTSCVEVRATDDAVVILDAGSGIRCLGVELDGRVRRIDILLSHLHVDHIIGLGFFLPMYDPGVEVHVWGPSSNTLNIHRRLSRYLSQPLFPVRMNDLPCRPVLHDVPLAGFEIPGVNVTANLICHPGPTVGYRLDDGRSSLAYLPDHEPALSGFPGEAAWTSGFAIARDVDLLIHDAQYTREEYATRIGWGHSTPWDAVAFADAAGAAHLVPFHHDPGHTDGDLDALYEQVTEGKARVTPAVQGATFDLGA